METEFLIQLDFNACVLSAVRCQDSPDSLYTPLVQEFEQRLRAMHFLAEDSPCPLLALYVFSTSTSASSKVSCFLCGFLKS